MLLPELKRPKSPDLIFRLYSRVLHPDWFEVKGHRRLVKDEWTADVRIISGGHMIAFRSGESWLTEVMAYAGSELPAEGLFFEARVRSERSTTLRPTLEVEYQTNFEIEWSDPEVFAHVSEELIQDTGRDGLFYERPSTNRLGPSEVSRVVVESRAKGLLVHTFHTFSEERAIVRTQSLFEIKMV